LSVLIEYFQPEKFIVVGDLLHAGDNSGVDKFCEWKAEFPNLEFHLVEGNHDRISKKLESKLCLNFRDETLNIDDFYSSMIFRKKMKNFRLRDIFIPDLSLILWLKKSNCLVLW
jgi:hypothetical protein